MTIIRKPQYSHTTTTTTATVYVDKKGNNNDNNNSNNNNYSILNNNNNKNNSDTICKKSATNEPPSALSSFTNPQNTTTTAPKTTTITPQTLKNMTTTNLKRNSKIKAIKQEKFQQKKNFETTKSATSTLNTPRTLPSTAPATSATSATITSQNIQKSNENEILVQKSLLNAFEKNADELSSSSIINNDRQNLLNIKCTNNNNNNNNNNNDIAALKNKQCHRLLKVNKKQNKQQTDPTNNHQQYHCTEQQLSSTPLSSKPSSTPSLTSTSTLTSATITKPKAQIFNSNNLLNGKYFGSITTNNAATAIPIVASDFGLVTRNSCSSRNSKSNHWLDSSKPSTSTSTSATRNFASTDTVLLLPTTQSSVGGSSIGFSGDSGVGCCSSDADDVSCIAFTDTTTNGVGADYIGSTSAEMLASAFYNNSNYNSRTSATTPSASSSSSSSTTTIQPSSSATLTTATTYSSLLSSASASASASSSSSSYSKYSDSHLLSSVNGNGICNNGTGINGHGIGNGGNGNGNGGGNSITSAAAIAACNCLSNLIARCCFGIPMLKAINVRRCVLALFAVTVVTILYYTHYVDTGVFVGLIQRDTHPSPIINCRMINGKHLPNASPAPDHRSEARLRIDPKVLVFVETTYSSLGRDIAELLVYNRIKYKIEVAGKSLPVLTNLDKGRYGVIVFENLDKYLQMDKWNRELLDKYCREYSVGVVGFVSPSEETLVAAQLRDFPLFVHTNLRLRDASLNPASSVLRLTRSGETAWGLLPGDDWAVFQHNHTTYEPIAWAQRNTQDYPSDSLNQVQLPLTTVLQDHGQYDGIQRVLFGSNLRFWLHRLLFLDALSYLSHGQLSLSLDRMILVDIDDIFVGEKGTRLRPDDVRALIATQKIIAAMVPGFRFNLGFSGKYYHHGTREENLGDDFLLQNVNEFNWFSHMWKHQQPHLYDNLTQLMGEMQLNYAFAKEHNIPTDSGYSISPHHSGVYPAHEVLYVAWKQVWNIKVTSTEEYPHLRPARLRRGFIHRNIMVLPRQTCGLFTHTMYIDRYPGGRDKLDESIQGGELFQTIVYNPINIFMTHMSNYGSDRLALYTFQSVIKFLQCWTNLKLASAPPVQLAEMYFRLHPDEVDPVWGNPCDDVRHKKIWSKTKSCDSLPKFLVIGPQKTGTTALYTFLSMHSSIVSNIASPETFEEIQFFNGNNYYRGLDWYMDFFPIESNTTTRYMFEKSATYFDGELVPKRAHALLPHAKIVSILISPAKRAYSWYQHQRAHGDVVANNYSFYQVITATDAAPKSLRDLRNRCLNPGKYAQHLEHWLAYYPVQQLHIIDGEQLRLNPVEVMNDLQRFLKIQPAFDYTNQLRFDVKKGFFCQVVSEKRNKCLGKSKGRQYPPMDDRSAKLLQRYYLSHNTGLAKLLKKLGSRPIPQWLKDDLSTST